MRWLDKSYAKILQHFRAELQTGHGLTPEEIEICLDLATQDLAVDSLFGRLSAEGVSAGQSGQVSGAKES